MAVAIALDPPGSTRSESRFSRLPPRSFDTPCVPPARLADEQTVRPRVRVLIVAFQTGRQADGGVESLTQLIEHYRGAELTVLTQRTTAKNGRWLAVGARVLTWPWREEDLASGRWSAARAWQYVTWNFATAWLAWRDFDVVHVNDPLALWHVAPGLRLLGKPVLFNIRDTKPALSRSTIWKWRAALALSTMQIVLSDEMRRFWKQALGVRAPALRFVYSIVDETRLRPVDPATRRGLRSRLGIDGFAIGYVASFSEKKAQLRFLESIGASLSAACPTATVTFIGDFNPERDPYAARCAGAAAAWTDPRQVRFAGYSAEPHAWYQALDIVVVATRNEGLARCMIESVACATPVVSFDVCSAREILEQGRCGLVVPQGDYPALVAAITRLASDATERLRLGANGARLARRLFNGNMNAARYLEAYRRSLGPTTIV